MADKTTDQVDTTEIEVDKTVEETTEVENVEVEATTSTTVEETSNEEPQAEEATEEADVPVEEEEDEGLYKWYIVNTYSGYEKKVAKHIEQLVRSNGLEDEITEVLVPTQEKVIAKDGKKRTVEEKLFPGYVLIKMIVNDQTQHLIRNTDGVTGFVGPSKKPTPLSTKEVKAILAFSEVKQTSYQTSFKVGDSVRVMDGPFKDFVGVVQEINEGRGQLSVLLSIFGRETPVQLDFLQVTNL